MTTKMQTHTEEVHYVNTKTAIYKAKREASEEVNPVDPLISDFYPPEMTI